MPKYVIEREIPGAGQLSAADLQAISQKSCAVLSDMGPTIQWVHSREHAEKGGFPVNRVSEIKTVIDPTTAE